jgi:hypothetical protein
MGPSLKTGLQDHYGNNTCILPMAFHFTEVYIPVKAILSTCHLLFVIPRTKINAAGVIIDGIEKRQVAQVTRWAAPADRCNTLDTRTPRYQPLSSRSWTPNRGTPGSAHRDHLAVLVC